MSNGARHTLGLLAGLAAVAAIAGALYEAYERQRAVVRTFQTTGTDHWEQMACYAGAALVIGIIAGSRISPLAALVPGLVFGGFGVLWAVQPNTHSDTWFPSSLRASYIAYGASGIYLLLGVALVVASLFPSRWRGKATPAAGRHSYDYAGPEPVAGYGEYDGPPALPYGEQGPGYGQNPDYRPGGDLYGDPIEQPPPAFGNPRDEGRGGWGAPPPGPPPLNSP
jgi:hypothetical protein